MRGRRGSHWIARNLCVVVGATGFEPATPCPPDRCANQAAPRPDVCAGCCSRECCYCETARSSRFIRPRRPKAASISQSSTRRISSTRPCFSLRRASRSMSGGGRVGAGPSSCPSSRRRVRAPSMVKRSSYSSWRMRSRCSMSLRLYRRCFELVLRGPERLELRLPVAQHVWLHANQTRGFADLEVRLLGNAPIVDRRGNASWQAPAS